MTTDTRLLALSLVGAWFVGGGAIALALTAQYGLMASSALWSLHGVGVALALELAFLRLWGGE